MKRSRVALLIASTTVVFVLAVASFAVRAGAEDSAYRQVLIFSEVLTLILDNYVDEKSQDSLLQGAYEGLMGGLDSQGSYLIPEELRDWKKSPAAAADPGISVLKAYRSLQVVAVAPGSPAEAAGILVGDQIRRVQDHPVKDLSLGQALRLLRGPVGSMVRLAVLHPQTGFRREEVEVKRVIRSDRPYRLQVEQGIGVLTVRDLTRVAADPLAVELESMSSRGVGKLLLDLRNAAEGSPREAAHLVELFTSGPLFQLKDRAGKALETVKASRQKSAWTGQIGVLVNGATAGGAEGVARLLQARRGATIYGEPTYGLGTEPRLFEFPDGTGLLVPAYCWEVVSGQGWSGDGIQPDRRVHAEGKPEDAEANQLRQVLEEYAKESAPAVTPKAA